MDTYQQHKITLRQGKLVVFTRAASANFQCCIKLPTKPYIYKSLGSVDRDEARKVAEDLHAEAKSKAESGKSIQHRTFKNVANEYLVHMRTQVDSRRILEKKLHDHRDRQSDRRCHRRDRAICDHRNHYGSPLGA